VYRARRGKSDSKLTAASPCARYELGAPPGEVRHSWGFRVSAGPAPRASAGRRAVRLRPCAAAATAARKIVRDTCAGRGLPTGLVEDAALVAGVLVTHSVLQAHTRIGLLVEVAAQAVLVRVEDDCGVLPPALGADRGTGAYGLAMVGRLARGSGFVRTRTGRQAWALLTRYEAAGGDELDAPTRAVA
jgi:hypothetical protein